QVRGDDRSRQCVQDVSRQDPREPRNLVIVVVVEDPEMLLVVAEVPDVDEGMEVAGRVEAKGIVARGQQDDRRKQREEKKPIHYRDLALTAARVSRSTSRRRIVSRLSCACLPLTSASA